MFKFAVILVVVTLLFRWALGQWPWAMLSGPKSGAQSRAQKLAEARKHLGVAPKASREDILSAHKRLITQVHPDRGGSNAEVHEANEARDILLAELAVLDAEQTDKDPPS